MFFQQDGARNVKIVVGENLWETSAVEIFSPYSLSTWPPFPTVNRGTVTNGSSALSTNRAATSGAFRPYMPIPAMRSSNSADCLEIVIRKGTPSEAFPLRDITMP
jgi:hypothetical protein